MAILAGHYPHLLHSAPAVALEPKVRISANKVIFLYAEGVAAVAWGQFAEPQRGRTPP
ncbi:MAG: hypothetical protein ACI9G1_005249 [Pirellulaceae bacterium]|jgi:hypothetical protein